jgi:hypothetical protein
MAEKMEYSMVEQMAELSVGLKVEELVAHWAANLVASKDYWKVVLKVY